MCVLLYFTVFYCVYCVYCILRYFTLFYTILHYFTLPLVRLVMNEEEAQRVLADPVRRQQVEEAEAECVRMLADERDPRRVVELEARCQLMRTYSALFEDFRAERDENNNVLV
jgi:hypothetical protein